MSGLSIGNRETNLIRQAADLRANTEVAKGSSGSGWRATSPAFENWLIQYRNRLAKGALESRNAGTEP